MVNLWDAVGYISYILIRILSSYILKKYTVYGIYVISIFFINPCNFMYFYVFTGKYAGIIASAMYLGRVFGR